MDIMFSVVGQRLTRLDNNYVVGDSKNYLVASFSFSEEWRDIVKTAVFKFDDNVFNIPIKDNCCIVPHEVIKPSSFLMSVFAGDLITANSVSIRVNISGISEGGEPMPPTPSVYAQIYKIADDAKVIAISVREDADSGKLNGKDGEKGDKGDTGSQGKQGDDGGKGEDGLPGMSAYETAVNNGYTGTEDEFNIDIARVNEEVRLTGGNSFSGIQTIDTKIVATRENTPIDNMLIYWDNKKQTFVSSEVSVSKLMELLSIIQISNGEVTINTRVNANQFNIKG